MSAAPRRAAFAFVFLTVALDMLALGIAIPVLPGLVQSLSGRDVAGAAALYGAFGTVFAAMQLVASPLLGALSDRFGRRPVILASNLGLGADYLLLALAPSLSWLFVGRVLAGLTSASVPTAFAYIADVTPAEQRAGRFGMVGAAFGLGFVLGPAVGGLLGHLDPRLPFYVSAALSLANATYGFFVLPESLPADQRRPLDLRRANPLGSLRFLRAGYGLSRLSLVAFLGNLAHEILPSIFVLHGLARYGWGEREVGLSLAFVGVCSSVVQAALVGRVVRGLGERRTLSLGIALGGTGMLLYALVEPAWVVFVAVPFLALWGLAGPASTGAMSKRVPPERQGELQGALAGLRGVAACIGPGLFTAVFAWAADGGRSLGLPFAVAAGLLGVAFVLARTVPEPPPA